MTNEHEFTVVGGASQEEKEKAEEDLNNLLFDHFDALPSDILSIVKKTEYPKSQRELAIIDFSQKATNKIMLEIGAKPFDIPAENYHLIPTETFKKQIKETGSVANTLYQRQGIFFNAEKFRDNAVKFGATEIHETLHLKGHYSVELEGDGKKVKRTPYREGVTIIAPQKLGYHGKYHTHFDGLHEAIVAEETKKLFPELLNLPEFTKEKAWLDSEKAIALRKDLSKKEEIPEDEFTWVGKNKEDWDELSYYRHRQVLEYICTEIQKAFPDQYPDKEAAFKEFLKAHFTGQLLTIARLVEEAFGESSFRILGNMTNDTDSAVAHLETFKKLRLKQLKAK